MHCCPLHCVRWPKGPSASGPRPQSVTEVMRITRLPDEPAERTLYRANAWLLTESLLHLPGGARRMQQLLAALGATRIFASAFDSAYAGDFPDESALEK